MDAHCVVTAYVLTAFARQREMHGLGIEESTGSLNTMAF